MFNVLNVVAEKERQRNIKGTSIRLFHPEFYSVTEMNKDTSSFFISGLHFYRPHVYSYE